MFSVVVRVIFEDINIVISLVCVVSSHLAFCCKSIGNLIVNMVLAILILVY